MLKLVLQGLLLYVICYILLRLFRFYAIKSTLHNIPGPKSESLIAGNLSRIFDPEGVPWHFDMNKKYGRVFKIHGLLGDEQIYVSDPLALHHIVMKDQDIYEETSMFIAANQLIFGHGLLGTIGKAHRKQRKILNPAFSIAHLRGLTPMFYEGAYEFREVLLKEIGDKGLKEIDMKPFIAKITLEYIGRGGFGYSFDSFDESAPNEYRNATKELTNILISLQVVGQFLPWVMKLGSASFRRKLIDYVPSKRLKRLRDLVDTLFNTSQNVYEKKKKDKGEGAVEGRDIMSVLMKANAASKEEDRWDDSEVLAQMKFLVAGQDTTGSAISRLLYLLAEYPDAQKRLRAEILEARENNGGHDLEYDSLVGLQYLDAVMRETLRLYCPFTFVPRTTRKDVVLPLSTPITTTDGKQISAIPLKNNTDVIIGMAAANRDEKIWGPDAEEWKPERWLGKEWAEGKEKLPGVYSGMMTFLGGSRACIGFKFSQLEIKVVVSILLQRFEFSLPDDKKIIFVNNAVLAPVLSDDKKGPSRLPLKVGMIPSLEKNYGAMETSSG